MTFDDVGYYAEKNFNRVQNLIEIYEQITPSRKGRKPVKSLDMLRVTIVLLHATLEDYLRSIMKIKLPEMEGKSLSGIPLYIRNDSFGTNPKFTLEELCKHKELSVEELIEKSVNQYLDRQSFNNVKEISGALERIGVVVTDDMRLHFDSLNTMILRRHSIVHQADREKRSGQGYHEAKSVTILKVKKWMRGVDEFMSEIAKQI